MVDDFYDVFIQFLLDEHEFAVLLLFIVVQMEKKNKTKQKIIEKLAGKTG